MDIILAGGHPIDGAQGYIPQKAFGTKHVLLTAKGIISAFQKREIGTVYPRQAELASLTLDLTWVGQRD